MFQQVIIMGNLGRAPEMRYTPAGKAVCSFSVATKDWKKNTIWWKVTAWEKLAETCNEYLKKGSAVHIVGEIKVDPDTGNPQVYQKRDGSWASSLELTARNVTFVGKKGNRETGKEVDEVFGDDDDSNIPPF